MGSGLGVDGRKSASRRETRIDMRHAWSDPDGRLGLRSTPPDGGAHDTRAACFARGVGSVVSRQRRGIRARRPRAGAQAQSAPTSQASTMGSSSAAQPQADQPVRLRQAAERHRSLVDVADSRQPLVLVEHEAAINLVAEQDRPVAARELGHPHEQLARRQVAGGIVRRARHDRALLQAVSRTGPPGAAAAASRPGSILSRMPSRSTK
jgi:hypothetical protein